MDLCLSVPRPPRREGETDGYTFLRGIAARQITMPSKAIAGATPNGACKRPVSRRNTTNSPVSDSSSPKTAAIVLICEFILFFLLSDLIGEAVSAGAGP